MHKRKVLLTICCVLIGIFFVAFFMYNAEPNINSDDAVRLKSNKVISLPGIRNTEDGFTCTGLVYDPQKCVFLVGNAGKLNPADEVFEANIVVLSENFETVLKTIDCYKFFPDMRDIQGVTIDGNGFIWLCSYGENKVRKISVEGNSLFEFEIKEPSGIAYSAVTNSLWVLTSNKLLNCDLNGKVIKSYSFKQAGQDQICIDDNRGLIYITAGNDYHDSSFVYRFDISKGQFELMYILEDSYAIEGIAIVNNYMYIMNDGLYHDAEISSNQVNIYDISLQ